EQHAGLERRVTGRVAGHLVEDLEHARVRELRRMDAVVAGLDKDVPSPLTVSALYPVWARDLLLSSREEPPGETVLELDVLDDLRTDHGVDADPLVDRVEAERLSHDCGCMHRGVHFLASFSWCLL